MENSKLCRICLITDVKTYDLQSYPLNKYFELVSGINVLTTVNLPTYACYECAMYIIKFYFFKQKCLRSQTILVELLEHSGKIDPSELSIIDRDNLLLSSNLSIYHIPEDICMNVVHTEIPIKYECNVNDPEFNKPIDNSSEKLDFDCVKQEDNYCFLSPKRIDSSDDDEPLSLHKEKKIKEYLEIIIEEDKVLNKNQPLDNPPVTGTQSVSTEIHRGASTLSEKRKRGRPKKLKVLKKFKDNILDYVTVINLSVEEQIEEINKRKQSSNYLNSPYQCNLCYKGFIDTDTWKHHSGKHSTSAGNFECPVCKFRFKTKLALHRHSLLHSIKYACKTCSCVSRTTNHARQHQQWHKGIKHECKYCGETFAVQTSYLSHVRLKHPSEFICCICGYSYVSKLGLTMHKAVMHKNVMKGEQLKEDGPYCEQCDVKFASSEAFKRHIIMSNKHNNINGCRDCGATFNNTEELKQHHRKNHVKKRPKNYGKKPPNRIFPAKCEYCTEIIPNANEHWSHHRRMHPDQKYPAQHNHMCDICGKSFQGNALLGYHKRTHTGVRGFKCEQCGKAFFNRANLLHHMMAHDESRPFPCTVCSKAFKCKGALDRHLLIHTGLKPYECGICGKAFNQSNSRKLHINTVHFKQPDPSTIRKRNKRKELKCMNTETTSL